MFDHGLEYLKKKLPGFEDKPSPQPAAQTAPIKPQPEPQPPPRPPAQNSPPNPVEILDSLTSFLRQYIVCDQHQLNVLALWIVHTWCYQYFPTTAYLNFHSPEPQSGKTRCLELLNLLANSPWLVMGGSQPDIITNLLNPELHKERNKSDGVKEFSAPHTILLDDCHHTFTSLERQPLLALLNTGTRKNGLYLSGRYEYCSFSPKAFASNSRLPDSLASRCIPIKLERRRPSDSVRRFDPDAAANAAAKLLAWLNSIGDNPDWVIKRANETPPGIPRRLTPREQDCAEPLIHIADAIGGHWPQKARNAIDKIFAATEGTMKTELLCDLRVIFLSKKDPEYLSTKDLLAELAQREYRPWSSWGSRSGKKLSNMLRPFGINPTEFHPEK